MAACAVRLRPDRDIDSRRYYDTAGRCYPASIACEHCDGVNSLLVRIDRLRGYVCPPCDSALDEIGREAMTKLTITFQLPVAHDELGRWMEDHGADVSLSCQFGRYIARVGWCKLHSYSDERGEHRESWSLSRAHEDPAEAMRLALVAAMKRSRELKP